MTDRDSWGARILTVVDHVQRHLDDEDLAPEQLAELAGFSLHHFHRVFRGLTGESVMGFVRRLRLERAAQRLSYEPTSVTEVAFDAGYNSHEAFTRAFRARFGVPPRDYRERHRIASADGPFELRDQPEHLVIASRHVGSYDECGRAWAVLEAWAHGAGVRADAGDSFGLCYDDPDVTATEHLRYDACLAFERDRFEGLSLPSSLARKIVPGGRYAVALHVGPHATLTDTYVALLGRWLPHRGVELAREPVVERYLNDPTTTPPAELRTEVCARLR
ncbi:MAG: AraC family transcriptional regulator [Polyangiaceae bacterium]